MKNNIPGNTARVGLMNFTFLISLNSRLTTHEFASMIRAGYDNPQAREVAQAIDNLDGMISRDWRGTKYVPLNAENAAEFYVRKAGWQADKSSPYPTMPYQMVQLPHAPKDGPQSLPGHYPSPAMAYAGAAKKLGLQIPEWQPATRVENIPDDDTDTPSPAP